MKKYELIEKLNGVINSSQPLWFDENKDYITIKKNCVGPLKLWDIWADHTTT